MQLVVIWIELGLCTKGMFYLKILRCAPWTGISFCSSLAGWLAGSSLHIDLQLLSGDVYVCGIACESESEMTESDKQAFPLVPLKCDHSLCGERQGRT